MALLFLAASAIGNAMSSNKNKPNNPSSCHPQQPSQTSYISNQQQQQQQQRLPLHPPLPAPWIAEWSPQDNRYIYTNPETGERTFQHPSSHHDRDQDRDVKRHQSSNDIDDACPHGSIIAVPPSPPPYHAPKETYDLSSSRLQQPNAWPPTMVRPVSQPAYGDREVEYVDRPVGLGLRGRRYGYRYEGYAGPGYGYGRRGLGGVGVRGGLISTMLLADAL